MSRPERLITVYRAAGEAEARVIQGLLESNGIPSLLLSNAAPSVHPFVVDGLGEYRVMVSESRAGEAAALIQDTEQTSVDEVDEKESS